MSDAPKTVSRFEANLLRLLRFILKQAPAEQAVRLLHDRLDRPPCLTADAVALVQDSLSKGCVLYLVRHGAWKRERFLRDGEARFGRLWDRSDVESLTLEFSPAVLEFLIWLTAVRVKEERTIPDAEMAHTPADALFYFLAYEAFRADADFAATMRRHDAFGDNALAWLMHPNDFAGVETTPDFAPWMTGPHALLLEAMQPTLEARWLEIEQTKGQVVDWAALRRQGTVQGLVVERFLQAADAAGRRDLTRFLFGMLARLLSSDDLPASYWTGGLQGAGPPRLAERLETQRSALAVVRSVRSLREWERQSRRSGFMDEDYALSKFWLGEWERFGLGAVSDRAERVLAQVEPLRTG